MCLIIKLQISKNNDQLILKLNQGTCPAYLHYGDRTHIHSQVAPKCLKINYLFWLMWIIHPREVHIGKIVVGLNWHKNDKILKNLGLCPRHFTLLRQKPIINEDNQERNHKFWYKPPYSGTFWWYDIRNRYLLSWT